MKIVVQGDAVPEVLFDDLKSIQHPEFSNCETRVVSHIVCVLLFFYFELLLDIFMCFLLYKSDTVSVVDNVHDYDCDKSVELFLGDLAGLSCQG